MRADQNEIVGIKRLIAMREAGEKPDLVFVLMASSGKLTVRDFAIPASASIARLDFRPFVGLNVVLMARTAGDNASVDAAGTISLPSGSTRPVLKTDSTVTLAKGDDLALNVTVSGTYSTTFPKVSVAVVTEPLA